MHDLILKGGRVIDPAQNIDRVTDVAFAGGKVAAIGDDLGAAAETRDVRGRIVTSGLIDYHTHVYWGGTSIGVDPAHVAAQSATATLIDAGTAGPANFHGFRAHVIEPCPVRVLAYINVSFPGIFAFSGPVMVGECHDLRLLDVREVVRVAEKHRDLLIGVKVRVGRGASGPSGIHPLDMAIEAADLLNMPVMAHLDYPPPSRSDVLMRMRKGDVLTHCFRPPPNAPAGTKGGVRPEVIEARKRGVIFDVGHGGGSFGFGTARAMLAAGFMPDIISSDIHILSIEGPAFDLLVTMSKFLCLGMGLAEVVRCATETPARAMRRPELGSLAVGTPGDASILELVSGEFDYVDVVGERIKGDRKLEPRGLVFAGKWWDAAKHVDPRRHHHCHTH